MTVEQEILRKEQFELLLRKSPHKITFNSQDEFNWFCRSLGFFEAIDRQKSASRILAELLSATEIGEKHSSSSLAKKLGLSRGAVINQLNGLLKSGLILKHGRFYFARSDSLEQIVVELQEEANLIFSKLRSTAKSLDEELKKRPRRLA